MSGSEPVMDAVEKVADFIEYERVYWRNNETPETDRPLCDFLAERLIAAFPQLALEGREEWEYAQGIPLDWDDDGTVTAWHVGKSFHGDSTRALDEGYLLVRRALGPWSEVES